MQAFRLARTCQVVIFAAEGGHCRKRTISLLPIKEVWIRNGTLIERRSLHIYSVEFVRIPEGQRIQQHTIDHGKKCGVRANPQRKRQHRNHRESLIIQKHTECIADVLPDVHHSNTPGVQICREGLPALNTTAPRHLFRMRRRNRSSAFFIESGRRGAADRGSEGQSEFGLSKSCPLLDR